MALILVLVAPAALGLGGALLARRTRSEEWRNVIILVTYLAVVLAALPILAALGLVLVYVLTFHD